MRISTQIIVGALFFTSTLYTINADDEDPSPTALEFSDTIEEDTGDNDEDMDMLENNSDWHDEYAGDMYKRWDGNGDGIITRSEIVAALMEDWEEEVWVHVDADKDGFIDPSSITYFMDLLGTEEASMAEADANGDGKISKKEAILFTEDFFGEDVFDDIDTSGDGKIDMKELALFMAGNSDKENLEPPEDILTNPEYDTGEF